MRNAPGVAKRSHVGSLGSLGLEGLEATALKAKGLADLFLNMTMFLKGEIVGLG